MQHRFIHWFGSLMLALFLGLGVTGCESNDGTWEEAGENVDEAMEDAGNEIEDACESAKENMGADHTDC